MTDTLRAAEAWRLSDGTFAPLAPLVTGRHTVFHGPFQALDLADSLPSLVLTDPPGLDDTASFGEVSDFFDRFFCHLHAQVARDCGLILVPRDRKGHPFQKSVICAYVAQRWGWQVFRQYTWLTGATASSDFHRARYAAQPAWALRRGDVPVQDCKLRYRDVLHAPDAHASGGMVMALPLDVVSSLLSVFARPDTLVLDPFAGSGSVMAAAHGLSLRSVSVEIDLERAKELAARAVSWGGLVPA